MSAKSATPPYTVAAFALQDHRDIGVAFPRVIAPRAAAVEDRVDYWILAFKPFQETRAARSVSGSMRPVRDASDGAFSASREIVLYQTANRRARSACVAVRSQGLQGLGL